MSSAPTAQRPPRVSVGRSPHRRRPIARRHPARVYWFRRIFSAVSIALFVVVSYLGITLVQALGNPSYGVGLMARAAEWGRMHGMSAVVSWAETEYYKLHPAKVGGKPPAGAFSNAATGATTSRSTTTVKGETYLPAPQRIDLAGRCAAGGRGRVARRPDGRTADGVPRSTRPSFVPTPCTRVTSLALRGWTPSS